MFLSVEPPSDGRPKPIPRGRSLLSRHFASRGGDDLLHGLVAGIAQTHGTVSGNTASGSGGRWNEGTVTRNDAHLRPLLRIGETIGFEQLLSRFC